MCVCVCVGGAEGGELLAGYKSQVFEKIANLENSISRLSSEEVRKDAHAIKSMSANIGAELVRQAASAIEESAKLGIIEDSHDSIDALSALVDNYLEAIRQYRSRHDATSAATGER